MKKRSEFLGSPLKLFLQSSKKRGISGIVATVLIVFVLVVAVTLIWIIITPSISKVSDIETDVELKLVKVDGYTVWDSENRLVTVQVQRSAKGGDIIGFNLIFVIGDDIIKHYVVDVPEPNGKKVYYIDLREVAGGIEIPEGDLTLIKIAPVFAGEVEGEVTDELRVVSVVTSRLIELADGDLDNGEQVFVAPNGGSGRIVSSKVWEPKESCFDNVPNQDETGVDCGGECRPCEVTSVCGDSIIQGLESCDDGNNEAGDGCSADCLSIEVSECMNLDKDWASYVQVGDISADRSPCFIIEADGISYGGNGFPIYPYSGVEDPVIFESLNSHPGLRFEGCSFKSQKPSINYTGIYLQGPDNLVIFNNSFEDAGLAISLGIGADVGNISYNNFSDSKGGILTRHGVFDYSIEDNFFENIEGIAVGLRLNWSLIKNNVIVDSDNGFDLFNSHGNILEGNNISSITSVGIMVSHSSENRFVNNLVNETLSGLFVGFESSFNEFKNGSFCSGNDIESRVVCEYSSNSLEEVSCYSDYESGCYGDCLPC